MTVSANMTDIEEVIFPLALFDQAGEEAEIPDGTTITPGTSDNPEVGVPSASNPAVTGDPVGLIVKSVGDDQPNTGMAVITGTTATLPDGRTIPLEDVVVTVGQSAIGQAGFGGGTTRPRT